MEHPELRCSPGVGLPAAQRFALVCPGVRAGVEL